MKNLLGLCIGVLLVVAVASASAAEFPEFPTEKKQELKQVLGEMVQGGDILFLCGIRRHSGPSLVSRKDNCILYNVSAVNLREIIGKGWSWEAFIIFGVKGDFEFVKRFYEVVGSNPTETPLLYDCSEPPCTLEWNVVVVPIP